MKEINITPSDLKELESVESEIKGLHLKELNGELKRVLDVVKGRKFTTYRIVTAKLGINARSARNYLEVLRERSFVKKQYAFLICSDAVKRKTALYYEVKKDGKGKRTSKKV